MNCNLTNCNTPFHNFWKNLNVDAFIPCLLLLTLVTGILYVYAFNVEYRQQYEESDVISYNVYSKTINCPNGNAGCNDHSIEYATIKYKRVNNPNIIHTLILPTVNCKDIMLDVNSDNPTKMYKCKVYNEYVGIFFNSNNSSKKMDKDLFVLE